MHISVGLYMEVTLTLIPFQFHSELEELDLKKLTIPVGFVRLSTKLFGGGGASSEGVRVSVCCVWLNPDLGYLAA